MAICLLIISIKLVYEGLNAPTAAFILMLETLRRLVIDDRIQFCHHILLNINPYPTAFPYGNGMVLHFYQQQESSMTKTVHKVINKGLKAYV